jgi:histidine triad (HIT) family protein
MITKAKKSKACRFCEIYDLHKDITFETRYFYGWFDEFPITPGHSEIVSKQHLSSFVHLNKSEWADLHSAIGKAVKAIENTNLQKMYKSRMAKQMNKDSKKFYAIALMDPALKKKPDAYNFGINEGKAAGRTVDHLHIHVIPRHFGDSNNRNGGIRGIRDIIPRMANYKNRFEL